MTDEEELDALAEEAFAECAENGGVLVTGNLKRMWINGYKVAMRQAREAARFVESNPQVRKVRGIPRAQREEDARHAGAGWGKA